jgi:hypothetical protein
MQYRKWIIAIVITILIGLGIMTGLLVGLRVGVDKVSDAPNAFSPWHDIDGKRANTQWAPDGSLNLTYTAARVSIYLHLPTFLLTLRMDPAIPRALKARSTSSHWSTPPTTHTCRSPTLRPPYMYRHSPSPCPTRQITIPSPKISSSLPEDLDQVERSSLSALTIQVPSFKVVARTISG